MISLLLTFMLENGVLLLLDPKQRFQKIFFQFSTGDLGDNARGMLTLIML